MATLDHIYSTEPELWGHPSILTDAASDHSPLLVLVHLKQASTPQLACTRRERDFKNLDKEALVFFLLDWDWWPVLQERDPDRAVPLLMEAIEAALDVVAPYKTYTTPNPTLRLQADTRATMRARDRAKKLGKPQYKHLRNRALALVRRDRVRHNLDRLRCGGQAAAWKLVAETRGKAKANLPLPDDCSTNCEAAEQCNFFYIDKVEKLRNGMPPADQTQASSKGRANSGKALRIMRRTEACGVDGVPVSVLKLGWPALAFPLAHVVNCILESATWPGSWKKAKVLPVIKPNKRPAEFSSYRPVALLPAVSKLAEKVLHRQLSAHVEQAGLLPAEQHGFRPGRGVDMALATVIAKLSEEGGKRGGAAVALAAFDFSAAFDTVDVAVLVDKLPWLEPKARTLITSYLTGRSQQVSWNGVESSWLPVCHGVPQGSVLGPLLFVLLTADLPAALDSRGCRQVRTSLYADDTACICTGASKAETESTLRQASEGLSAYSAPNHLHLNMEKTKTLHLERHPPGVDPAPIALLGVTLDGRLSFKQHHALLLGSIRARIAVVRRLATAVSRGPLLKQAAWALVIGKIQCAAWVTRQARVRLGEPIPAEAAALQIAVNDLARTLVGARRAQHITVKELLDKTGLPSINQVVVQQAGIAAWKAVKGSSCPISELLTGFDTRTQSLALNLVKPAQSSCVPSENLARVWNASPDIRQAETLSAAKTASRKFAFLCRFY